MTSTAKLRALRHVVMCPGDCRTVRVTATLQHGAVLPIRFAAPLDGILASTARRRRLGPSYGSVVDHHTEPLPLTATLRWHKPREVGFGDRAWVWAASCAVGIDPERTDLRHIHRRAWSEQQTSEVGIVGDKMPANPDVGPFKAWRIPLVATTALRLEWVAVGDPDGIRSLLDDTPAIGKKVNIGEGSVVRWDVEDVGEPDIDAALWVDGRISRPVPIRHAAALGVAGCDSEIVDAYRPPYWRPAMNHSGRREPREVIASWTRKEDDNA